MAISLSVTRLSAAPFLGDDREPLETDNSRVAPDNPLYLAVIEKRFNKRFKGSPD